MRRATPVRDAQQLFAGGVGSRRVSRALHQLASAIGTDRVLHRVRIEATIDPLGVKADFYRALALEHWGPTTRRTDVRLAVYVGVIGIALLVAGVPTIVLMHDLNALVGGLLAIGYAYSVLWPFRDRWRSWRRAGTIALEMADLNIVPGELTTCTLVIAPRRDATIVSATLEFEYRDSRAGAGPTAWQVDIPLADPLLRRGIPASYSADVVLPPGVPPSRFDGGWTRQWSVTAVVSFADGSTWERAYPVMVYPTP